MLTVDRFFHGWRVEKMGIAAALKAAQLWLRSLTVAELETFARELRARGVEPRYVTPLERYAYHHRNTGGPGHRPFADPSHWAAFVAVGQAWTAGGS